MSQKLNWHMMPMVTQEILDAGHSGGEGGQWELCVTCDSIDGSLLFTGTDVGGMFRSKDGGEHWEPCNIGLDARGCCFVCIDPINKNHLIAVGCNSGSNEYNGIYVSYDMGDTWTHTFGGYFASYRDFRDQVAIDPSSYNEELGYCTTAYWSRINNTESKGLWGEFRECDALFKTVDGGESWSLIKEGFGDAIVKVHPKNRTLYIAHRTGFFVSKDGGESYTLTFEGKGEEGIRGLDVIKTLPDSVFINTIDGVYRSDDCGESFKFLGGENFPSGVENHASWLKVSPADPDYMAVCKMSHDYNKKVFITHDGAKSWREMTRLNKLNFIPYNNRQSVFAWNPLDRNIMWTLGGDYTCRSTDGGYTSDWYHNGNLGILAGDRIHLNVFDPDLFYYASQDYDGCVTFDGGKTWKYVNMYGETWGGFCYGGYAIDKNTFVCGRRAGWHDPSELYVTHDGGETVVHTGLMYDTVASAYGDPRDPDVAFCGPFRTADRGYNWEKMDGCIAVTDHNHEDGTLVGLDGSKVVISADHGITWQVVADCGVSLRDACVDHKNNIYFACGNDRLFRINEGVAADITENMPANQFGWRVPHGLAIDKRYTNVIYVTGGGNWYMNDCCTMRSIDGGDTWQVLTRNKRNSIINDGYGLGWEADAICCRPDNGMIYVPGACFGFATIDGYCED